MTSRCPQPRVPPMVPTVARTEPYVREPKGFSTSLLTDPRWFSVRQVLLILGALGAYFGVRGLTEGAVDVAQGNAGRVLDLERSLGLAHETAIQDMAAWSDLFVDMGNWVYIWFHWPLILGTFVWFAWTRRGDYLELRNAMFISGAIGLVIFALFPVAPPRLFGPEFVDTVSERSRAYRVLQPPAFTNKYAAVPSFHFGWNLLVGMAWFSVWRGKWWRWVGVAMPIAMGWAVVVTANHWVIDVVAGGAIAVGGLAIARWYRARQQRRCSDETVRDLTSASSTGARIPVLDGARSNGVGDAA